MAVRNEFVTRFLVEYAIKNENKMLAQDNIFAKFNKGTARVGAALQKTSRQMKTFGTPAGKHKEILQNLADNYKRLGYDIRNSAKAEGEWYRTVQSGNKQVKKKVSDLDVYTASMMDLSKRFTPVQKGSEGWAKAEENLINKFKSHGKNAINASITTRHFMGNLKDAGLAVNENGEFFDEGSGKIQTMDKVMGKASRYSMQQFKAAAMGIMFMGQGMAATFGGMIKDVLGAVGVFDAFRGILMGILLPVLMPLIEEWLPKFLDWLEKPGNSSILGWGILFAFVLGKILAWGGALVLLFGSLGWTMKMWEGTTLASKLATGGLWVKLVVLAGALAVVANAIDFVKGIMEGKFMKAAIAVIGIIGGVVAIFAGAIPAAIGLAVAAFAWLANKFGYFRVVVMALLSPIMWLVNGLKLFWDLASGKGMKASVANYDAASKKWYDNMEANRQSGWGGAVESEMFQGKNLLAPSLIEDAGGDSLTNNNVMNDNKIFSNISIDVKGNSSTDLESMYRKLNEYNNFLAKKTGG